MAYQNLIFEKRNQIGYLTLNRPSKLNALSKELMAELAQAFDAIEADDEVRVVILTGAGRAFSAGFNIAPQEGEPELYERSADSWRSDLKQNIETFLKIWHSGKPYIAAINGYALAGACELAQLCDIKIASDRAVLGESEIRAGVGPPLLITPFSIGLARSKELLLTGDTIDAHEAARLGTVNRVVPHDNLMAECEKIAKKICLLSPVGVNMTKMSVNRALEGMGFLSAISNNLELMIHFDISSEPEQDEFNKL